MTPTEVLKARKVDVSSRIRRSIAEITSCKGQIEVHEETLNSSWEEIKELELALKVLGGAE